ncbi:TetR/AcrR family transcriptional regulator [Amycolatopsis cynarae]|uniref:TetR/AcrR family transcriptional regulator n=1 Tax=Amycolatopsis cynarae TaxID=2995223 RepID=A0ABY7AVA4_9PSEU|nr:TetR/AcrR family transcriptional regulator [Amycolatopsis sp. HUAS 11-8]WAL63911.1 TetR/AcrR family transcriptional regulator [Amycolatopsis sp. HUAS 11-8]
MAGRASGGGTAWQWSRTAETRQTLLDSARAVFGEHGYAEASVAEVVRRAQSSVGSLYHHFGGKAELYLALWEEHQGVLERSATAAVSGARARGEEDPLALLIAGARAYLEASWQQRDLVRLFMNDDGPPGFDLLRRTRGREWVRQNAVLLGAGADPVDRLTVSVITAIIGEAGREIAACAGKRKAATITEAAVGLIRKLDPLTAAAAKP